MAVEDRAAAEGREAATREARPVEERAEEIVERVTAQVSRVARRFVSRAREEVEDIVAEAQELRRGTRPPG
jgi:DNA-directed RNA polymerase specialized sigma subunit